MVAVYKDYPYNRPLPLKPSDTVMEGKEALSYQSAPFEKKRVRVDIVCRHGLSWIRVKASRRPFHDEIDIPESDESSDSMVILQLLITYSDHYHVGR